ncbi:MAG: ATP-binding protein [Thermoplasmatota archaeon]
MTGEVSRQIDTFQDVEGLVKQCAAESEDLEYKAHTSIDEISPDVCAMANKTGGFIVIGIRASDRLPEEVIGWQCPRGFDNGLVKHLRSQAKPTEFLDRLSVVHIPIPTNVSLCVTVIRVPDARESIWYRASVSPKLSHGEIRDELCFRRGSSTQRATTREDILAVVFGKSDKSLELAQIELENDRFEEARQVFSDIIVRNAFDVHAWIGKAECDAFLYDASSVIASIEKVAEVDNNLARESLFDIINGLESLRLRFVQEKHVILDDETKEFELRESDIPPPETGELDELNDTLEELTEEYCRLYPQGAECHFLMGREYLRSGEKEKALEELTKVEKSTDENSDLWKISRLEMIGIISEKEQSLVRWIKVIAVVSMIVAIYVSSSFLSKRPPFEAYVIVGVLSFLAFLAGWVFAPRNTILARLRREGRRLREPASGKPAQDFEESKAHRKD